MQSWAFTQYRPSGPPEGGELIRNTTVAMKSLVNGWSEEHRGREAECST